MMCSHIAASVQHADGEETPKRTGSREDVRRQLAGVAHRRLWNNRVRRNNT